MTRRTCSHRIIGCISHCNVCMVETKSVCIWLCLMPMKWPQQKTQGLTSNCTICHTSVDPLANCGRCCSTHVCGKACPHNTCISDSCRQKLAPWAYVLQASTLFPIQQGICPMCLCNIWRYNGLQPHNPLYTWTVLHHHTALQAYRLSQFCFGFFHPQVLIAQMYKAYPNVGQHTLLILLRLSPTP